MEKTASQIQKERIKELEAKANVLIVKCDVATLTSINEKGYPRTCVLSIYKADGFSDIYFVTSKRSAINGKATHFEANLKATVFDDFIQQSDARIKDCKEPIDPKVLWDIRTRLRENNVKPLDMWMVLYTHEFGLDERNDASFKKYIEPFDGVIMWNWKESDADLIPEKFEHFKKMTPNSRRMFGCYLYNFGEWKQATGEAVKWQLDFYRDKMIKGEAEGVVPRVAFIR